MFYNNVRLADVIQVQISQSHLHNHTKMENKIAPPTELLEHHNHCKVFLTFPVFIFGFACILSFHTV